MFFTKTKKYVGQILACGSLSLREEELPDILKRNICSTAVSLSNNILVCRVITSIFVAHRFSLFHYRNGNDEEDAIRRHRVKKRGSDASFNSSIESFISAVASREDLVSLDVTDAAPTCSKPLILPALAGLYGQHLKRATCSNWKCVPPEELSRRCSLLTNLKVSSWENF